jgi:ACS family hexuronate transporter-like MFS transporter
MREFGLDKEGFGRLVAVFRYFYAAVQIGGGWLADCLGPRGLFPAAVGLWSAAGMMSAWAPGLWSLTTCRAVLGIGEAYNWPCALKTTERRWWSPDLGSARSWSFIFRAARNSIRCTLEP